MNYPHRYPQRSVQLAVYNRNHSALLCAGASTVESSKQFDSQQGAPRPEHMRTTVYIRCPLKLARGLLGSVQYPQGWTF